MVDKWKITFVYDRSVETRIEVMVEFPKKPSMQYWDVIEIAEEKYWRLDYEENIYIVRQRFLSALLIEKVIE